MSLMPTIELGHASVERLNDVTFYLKQLINHFLDPKDDVVRARAVDHNEYLLEFGRRIDHDLNWNAHRTGTFGREVVYVRNEQGEMQATSLSTHRRLVRVSREKGGSSRWIVTTLEGMDFDGRNIGISALVGVYMEEQYKSEMEYRRKNPDYSLPGKVGQMIHTVQHLASELGVNQTNLTWAEAVELLHRLQRQYGMWEPMKDNALHFNADRSKVAYAGD